MKHLCKTIPLIPLNKKPIYKILGVLLSILAVVSPITSVYAAGCGSGNCGNAPSGGYTNNTNSYGNNSGSGRCTYGVNPYPYNPGVDERAYSQEVDILRPNDCRPCSPGTSGYYEPCCDFMNNRWVRNVALDVERDFTVYFQSCNLLWLGAFFVGAGITANTGLDRSIRNHWQRDIRSNNTNSFFQTFNTIGGLSYWYFILYTGSMLVGSWQDCTIGGNFLYHWGYRSLRTLLLASVQQLPLAIMIGSGRPSRNEPSKWQPFKYKTGVSGHTVYGAVPFLTAAMMADPPVLRFTLFALSTLPGLARINNNAHYFSQVLLGWGIAYLSARAVYRSDQLKESGFEISVVPKADDGAMLYARYQF